MSRTIVASWLLATALSGCAPIPANTAPPPAGPAPAPEPLIEWNAGTGTIRCRSSRIDVPPALRDQVRWSGPDELTLLPSASPPGGALVVGALSSTDDRGVWAYAKDALPFIIKLHQMAVGDASNQKDLEQVLAVAKGDGAIGAEISDLAVAYDWAGQSGRVVYLHAGGCRLAALDYPVSATQLGLTPLLDDMVAQSRAAHPPRMTPF